MPVWHEATREWRESGELVVVGIASEQHAERCRLFAQWKGLDWPILWDPYDLTGSKVVPSVVAVDEHGIVRAVGPDPATFEETFLLADFEPPAGESAASSGGACVYGEARGGPAAWERTVHLEGVTADELHQAVEQLEDLAAKRPDEPAWAFRAGVVRRMRFDSTWHRADDFQAAVDHWARALDGDPNQYIWRRRIQQYGPRMDKPYAFYDWVTTARSEIEARGEAPVRLGASLTPAELAEPRRGESARVDLEEPDPDGEVERDDGMIAIESAVAFDTGDAGTVASVHLVLRPDEARAVHWNHESGPPVVVWMEAPEGVVLDPAFVEVAPRGDLATSPGPQHVVVEATLPGDVDEVELTGYALYFVCEGASGTCLYRRQDLRVSVRRP